MVTIEDVANAAGVSRTTVSNVILGRTDRVSNATAKRIKEIINEKGYVPNMSARALVYSSSKVVALINHLDSSMIGNFIEDPFHNAFIGAIEETLREGGYYLMIRSVSNTSDLLAFLRGWNVDGLFMVGLSDDEELYTTLTGIDKPIVLVDSYLREYGNMLNIGLEDFEGAYLGTQHLIANNHRRIAFVSPSIHSGGVMEQRLFGYKKALNDAKIPFDPNIVFEQGFSTTETMRLGKDLSVREDITALFATADIMAAGIMSGLQQAGRKVPDDFSIVGFDDINWCRMTMPMLTTVHQDANKKGEIAARSIMELLAGCEVIKKNITLPVRLVMRDSVKSL
jgi:LacI family transcriptional regulator